MLKDKLAHTNMVACLWYPLHVHKENNAHGCNGHVLDLEVKDGMLFTWKENIIMGTKVRRSTCDGHFEHFKPLTCVQYFM